MREAPFHAALADGPAKGHAVWVQTGDGVRIRLGIWPEGERGTVLLFPGRSEYVEKYGRAAADLRARGYATITIDWRGQGLADHALADPMTGHVGDFDEYQRDVDAMLAARATLGLPEPLFLLAHSMGGNIGLRSAMRGLDLRAAAFTAPMWGIPLGALMRPFALAIARGACCIGQGHRYAPGTGPANYTTIAAFEGNSLTTDPEMWAYMQEQVIRAPALALGGPSLSWVAAALSECRALAALPAPPVPAITALGTAEQVVDPAPIHARMADWPGGRLDLIEGAQHEVMMETPATRARFFAEACALFDAQQG
ncbi:alpha/beta hydrolase [Thioclava sp. BHET1]|nr:alpha/beta hydrolase [Thioclava sp. BHET1]